MTTTSKHIASLDAMRLIAIAAVVMIHISAPLAMRYNIGTEEFFVGNIFDSFSRIGVPLFVMISGALMLNEDKQATLRYIFGKIKRILFLLMIWSLFYAVVSTMLSGGGIIATLKAFLFGHFHLWYLYMLVGLYLATPFLRSFVKRSNKKVVSVFICIALLKYFADTLSVCFAMFWPPLSYLAMLLADHFQLSFFFGYTIYYLAGWYVAEVGFKTNWTRRTLYVAGMISALIVSIGVLATGNRVGWYSATNIFTFVYAVAVFCLVYNVQTLHVATKNGRMERAAKLSFGVYLIHPAIQTALEYSAPSIVTMRPTIMILVEFILVYTTSFLACHVMARTPIIKRLICV